MIDVYKRQAYEREKKKLQGLPSDEYEAALKELARRMGI